MYWQRQYNNSKEEVILGIAIGSKLNFDCHIRKTCKKSGNKLNVPSRISTFLNKKSKKDHFQYDDKYSV